MTINTVTVFIDLKIILMAKIKYFCQFLKLIECKSIF